MKNKKPNLTELVLRDGQQSLIATRMTIKDMIPILPKLNKVGYESIEVWGGATYDCCLRYLNEDPWVRLSIFKKYLKNTKLQMLLRGQNIVGYKRYDDSVLEIFINNSAKKGIDIFRSFDSLNDINNINKSITYINKTGKHSQGTMAYTTSPIHDNKYWLKFAKKIEDVGAKSLAIKDMAGLLRPYAAYDLIKLLKKNMKIPIFLHSHATTGLSDATNIKAYEAGVDNLDASISSFSGTYGHTATESLISMIYQNDENPYDMKLLNEINVYFSKLREKYKNFEGSLKGIDTTMLYNQVPGGMLSNLERQLKDLDQEDKFKQLIDEIPNIRADLGYVPLVTPTSQIVGTQALMNILDGERYKNLTNEMIDLVTGKYGKIPGKISNKLLKIAEKKAGNQDCEAEKTIEIYKKDFKDICINNDLSNLYKNETDLLNYILFPDVAVNYYIKRKNASDNEVFDLQESLGFIIPD